QPRSLLSTCVYNLPLRLLQHGPHDRQGHTRGTAPHPGVRKISTLGGQIRKCAFQCATPHVLHAWGRTPYTAPRPGLGDKHLAIWLWLPRTTHRKRAWLRDSFTNRRPKSALSEVHEIRNFRKLAGEGSACTGTYSATYRTSRIPRLHWLPVCFG